MKAGIVTTLGNNYGGALQAYALKKSLEKLNLDVEILNYIPKYTKTNFKDIVKKIIYAKRNAKFEKFRKEYFNLTCKIKNLEEYIPSNDIYIAGSDQIWNSDINFDIRKYYYLDFIKNKRKISYAASVGKNYFTETEEEKKEISRMLNSFNAISIREQEGVELYKQITDKHIENVLDPTLLLNKNEWQKIESGYNPKRDYIFVYTLGANREIKKTIDEFSKKCGSKIVDINYKREYNNILKYENGFGPTDFLAGIDNSKYVITNSFHGMVFSILFEKTFFVITRGNMNSRMESLLKKLNLTNRIIKEENIEELLNKTPKEEIDYKKVHEILEKEKEKSLNFLKEALEIK